MKCTSAQERDAVAQRINQLEQLRNRISTVTE